MARRRSRKTQEDEALAKRRVLVERILWTCIVVICLGFGLANSYETLAGGQILEGLLRLLVYSGGALGVILAAYYINRKLKGL